MNDDQVMLKEFMLNIVRQITLLGLDDMRAINADSRSSMSYWDSFGAMIDPTQYRDMLQNGTRDSAKLQSEIVDHLIAIREIADKLEALHQKHAHDAS